MWTIGVTLFTLLWAVSCANQEFPQLSHIRPKVGSEDQAQAAKDLLSRFLGLHSESFQVKVNQSIGPKDKDTFEVRNGAERGQIIVTGTSGVAVAMGAYYYLKSHVNVQFSWAGKQTLLPPLLPAVQSTIKITSNDRFRYYQNVCTVSYSMAFWAWERWEREIDWMALQGINLPLAFTGQEAIFQRVFLQLGFNQTDLDEHFGGPAFLAWARMGNIEGWGGPLPQMWITNKLVLQHKILDRMRSLGMTPVLPGFAGHMPRAVTRVFPKVNVTKAPNWGHFNSTYSGVYLLDFQEPLFKKIGQMVITELTNEFGTNHIYNMDTFNELTPASSDPSYLTKAGKAVYDAMIAGDPQGVWLMQGWLFVNKVDFWKPPQVKALVRSVPQGRMIILDLASETSPVYQKFESYYGQPWIWCMLHNYGGTNELYGAIDSVNKGPFTGRAFPNSSMIGTGITPEGINQNELMYEFMNENAWAKAPRDIDTWVTSYTEQRYALYSPDIIAAWKLLMKTVYNCTDGHHDNDHVIITQRPRPNIPFVIWYKPEDLYTAWDGFLNASQYLEGSPLFHYDITDVTRNSLQVLAMAYYSDIVDAFNKKDTDAVKVAGAKISQLLADMDHLLNSNERFLLGRWIADAKAWATDEQEKKLLEFNARNQITLWGPEGNIVDYASKQWAGVMADYYKPRWEFFSNWLVELIHNETKWTDFWFELHILPQVEIPWTQKTYSYPITPTGNPIEIARELHTKYRPDTRREFFQQMWQDQQTRKKTLRFKSERPQRRSSETAAAWGKPHGLHYHSLGDLTPEY